MTTLDQLGKGESGTIIALEGGGVTTQRLLALGLLPGRAVRIVGLAPLGDPITVETDSGRISLRRAEAAAVQIDSLPAAAA